MERIKDVSEQIAENGKNSEHLKIENDKFILNSRAIPETVKIIINVIEGYKATTDIAIKNRLLGSIIDKVIYSRQPGSEKHDIGLEIYVKKFSDMVEPGGNLR